MSILLNVGYNETLAMLIIQEYLQLNVWQSVVVVSAVIVHCQDYQKTNLLLQDYSCNPLTPLVAQLALPLSYVHLYTYNNFKFHINDQCEPLFTNNARKFPRSMLHSCSP